MINAIPAIAASMLVFFITVFSGRNGVYLFDTGIVYNMGWLIYNGFTPYIDFTMPLTPMSGLLAAASFKMFGVNYMAQVYMASFVSASALLISYNNVRNIVRDRLIILLVLTTAVAATVPMIGTLYYNHLSLLLIVVICSFLIKFIYMKKNEWCRKYIVHIVLSYFFIGLLLLTKLHFGLAYLCVYGAVELWVLRRYISCGRCRILNELAVRALVVSIFVFGLIIWAKFDLAAIKLNLFKTARPTVYGSSLKANLPLPTNIFSTPHIQLFLLVTITVLILAVILREYYTSFYDNSLNQSLCLALTGVMIGFAQLVLSLTTPDPNITIPVQIIIILLIYMSVTEFTGRELKTKSNIFDIFSVILLSVLMSYIVFIGSYIYSSGRKSWSEQDAKFNDLKISSKSGNLYHSSVPFFKDVSINQTQKENFEYLYQICELNRDKKIFFGPELEIFYGITGNYPPRRWPLWLHPAVSYDTSKSSELIKRLAVEKYDLIILSKSRFGLAPFISAYLADNNYVRLPHPANKWVIIYKRVV